MKAQSQQEEKRCLYLLPVCQLLGQAPREEEDGIIEPPEAN